MIRGGGAARNRIAAILLAGGTPGKRAALPNATILIHQPRTGGAYQGQVSDLEIQAAEIERMRRLMEDTLAHHTGRTSEQVRIDTDRDKILTAAEAKDPSTSIRTAARTTVSVTEPSASRARRPFSWEKGSRSMITSRGTS